MISLRMISTDDNEVCQQLRDLDQPAKYFGEGPAERRERLRQILTKLGPDALEKIKSHEGTQNIELPTVEEKTWYHEGSELLKSSRFCIARYSIEQCKSRLDMDMLKQMDPASRSLAQQELIKRLRTIDDCSSQIGDKRPLSSCNFSPDSKMIATSSWSGLCKLWTVPDLIHKHTLRGHSCNVSYITFHPHSTRGHHSEKSINLASCAMDGSVLLWNLIDEEPIRNLKGHEGHRVTRVKFHPMGNFLATCCSDKSWRFWNLEYNEEILHQEGHSGAVYDIAFHPDGSLAATAGLDSYGRIFDLRSGRQIMLLEGHLKELLSIDCSPDGYHIATGSEDHSVKIWDLRQRKCEYTIPAHTNNVIKVIFEKRNGFYLATASYDRSIKLWSRPIWAPIQTLYGHDERIMGMDCSEDSELFATCAYDKTFKLWRKVTMSRNQLEDHFLRLNRDMKEIINKLIYGIDQKLDMFEELEYSCEPESTKEKSYSTVTFMTFKAPYVRDIKNLSSPKNQDAKQQIELDARINLQSKPTIWSERAKKRLLDAVLSKYSKEHIAYLLKQKDDIINQLETTTSEQVTPSCKLGLIQEQIEQVRDKLRPNIFVPEEREDKNVDWLSISAKLGDLNYDNRDCELMWKNQLHPMINTGAWSKDEDDKLLKLISEHGTNNWELLSHSLNTNRLSWQCCSRYQSELCHDNAVNLPVNQQEYNLYLEKLYDIVQSCRIGDFIPWNQVMFFVEGRSTQQVKLDWHKYASSHSIISTASQKIPWNEYEDLALMIGVRLFGLDWLRISNYIPGRSNKSCRERYSMRLIYERRSIGEWASKEDSKLLMLAEKHDKNWSKVAAEMGHRNLHQVRSRFILLNKAQSSSVESPRNKIHHIYDPFDYILKCTPRTFVISKTSHNKKDEEEPLQRRIYEDFLEIIQRKLKLVHELSLSVQDIQTGLTKKLSKDSEVEDQLLEIFSAYSHVKPTKSLVFRSSQDEIIYQSLINLVHSRILCQEESSATTNLIDFVLMDALNHKVSKINSAFPPNFITLRGLRGFMMQQSYLQSLVGDEKDLVEDTKFTNEYMQLRRVILSLFLWPMSLSNMRPPKIDLGRWASYVERSIVDGESRNLYKIRDLQSKLTENK